METLVAYFHTRQYLPFGRLKETLNDAFGIPISEGGIYYLLRRFVQKATPIYQMIKLPNTIKLVWCICSAS